VKKRKEKAKRKGLSIRELARKTGADRASIKKWIVGVKDEADAIKIIEERKRKAPVETAIDPDSGLSWFQAKAKEDTLKQRRLNEVAEKVKSEEWMATATHHAMVTMIVGQLELLPGKAKSQLGLDARQSAELQRMIDEVRTNAAGEIEKV
jgi:hypothetical protein